MVIPRRRCLRMTAIAMMTIQTNAMAAAQSSNSSHQSGIDTAVATHNLLFWAYLFVLVAVVGFTYAVWRSGNKVQDAIRSDADARITEAKAEGARANERAGKLEREAAELREQAAVQQERAAKAEQELIEVKARVTPRHLTADQRDQLTARLLTRPKGFAEIRCPINDPEACVFAEELQSVLNDAGWTTDFVQAALVRVPTGVQVSQRNEGDGLPHVNALYEAFRVFGIDTSVVYEPSVPENRARVLVGRKP